MPRLHIRRLGAWAPVRRLHVRTSGGWLLVKRAWIRRASGWSLTYVLVRVVTASASFSAAARNRFQGTATTEGATTVDYVATSDVSGVIGSGTLTVTADTVTTPLLLGAFAGTAEAVSFAFTPRDATGVAGDTAFASAFTP